MIQYINKDSLVAEIEKFIERAKAERVLHPKTILAAKNYLLIEDYNKLLSFINTIEVKEIDKDKQYQELLEKSVQWFNDIAELCSKLTSGNVSHLGATIKGKAIRSAEFIEKHKNN